MVSFQLPISVPSGNIPKFESKEIRELKKISITDFKDDIHNSSLNCSEFPSFEEAVVMYHDVLSCLLNKHAPMISKNFKCSKSSFWNSSCQEAVRIRRQAERKLKKHPNNKKYKIYYKEKCVDAEITINKAQNSYYDKRLTSLKGDSKATYKSLANF